ncbi:MAG: hypothetical protein CMM77_14950 [Rhodospirillaceae bacterium]|nr:hypothetical protein [Rhodospirillaceae bacterium]|tara:strand:+ start:581 stop:781 length:201 start_codon:yes stop_codon:yes gene_type:complete
MKRAQAALSDPVRLAALGLLWEGKLHRVCELMARVGVRQSRMSRHMKVLREAGLVVAVGILLNQIF